MSRQRTITVTLYRTLPLRQWRWRAVAANGRKIANGGESYANKADCVRVVNNLFANHGVELLVPGHKPRVLRQPPPV